MEQQTLFIIAGVVAVIGIVGLFFIQPEVSPNLLSISGEVVKSRTAKGVTFFEFVPSEFEVIAFDELALESANYTLHGRLQEYKGKLEFVMVSYD